MSPNRVLVTLAVTGLSACSGGSGPPASLARSGRLVATTPAPIAERRPHRFTLHGITVEDPYRWLRDPDYPTVDDPDVLAYLEAENAYFQQVMKPHRDLVDAIYEELKAREKQDDASVPWREGAYLYQWRYSQGSEYRLWTRRPLDGGDEQVILDEPALAGGHEYFKVGALSVSNNGRYLAWTRDTSGAERFELTVVDLETGDAVDAPITDVSGAPAWSADDRVLVYTRIAAERWRPFQIRAHRLGAAVVDDRVLFEEPDERYFVALDETRSGEFLLFGAGTNDTREIRVVPTADPFAAPRTVAPREPGVEYDVEHAHGRFYVRINDRHDNFRIVTAPQATPGRSHWRELIPGSDGSYLRGLDAFRDFLVISERVDGVDQIRIRSHDGVEHRVEFPEPTYAVRPGTNEEFAADFVRLEYESMITPDTILDYRPASRELITRKVMEIPSGYDRDRYETVRLKVTARDGVEVPVSVVHRKDYRRNDGQPLHVYGYGAYGYGQRPTFSAQRLSLLDRGFAFAIAHVRGGDEMGYGWYLDGKLGKRTNTFNDFVDVTRALIERGYGAPGRVSASGGSAGGELMGAVVNQDPGLWGAVVARVPFVDVLNTMLDASLPLTPMEWREWGNPIESKQDFELIRSYSPYDQVREQPYPPMLITAGINDPRVTYWEPAKWAARLRHLKTDDNVLLLKTNMGSGHFGKTGRFAELYEKAEEFAFILLSMAHED